MGFRVDAGTIRSSAITFMFDGAAMPAHVGETIAAALLANGIRASARYAAQTSGPYCNMGTCLNASLK